MQLSAHLFFYYLDSGGGCFGVRRAEDAKKRVRMAKMRYSEMPTDYSCDNLAAMRINEDQLESCWSHKSSLHKIIPIRRESSVNELKHLSIYKSPFCGSPETLVNTTTVNYHTSSLPRCPPIHKSHSLPRGCEEHCHEAIQFNILQVPPEDFASQLTRLDIATFRSIAPDELSSCAWNKKNKLTVAPNVVAFTRRFNLVSFWTVEEVLSGDSPKKRAEVLGHFIRIAKKLHELNNLHSLFAIVSALQSASVFRLNKTWGYISKKERQTFDKLAEVFSNKNNWGNLREHMESLKLPCIPYLGLFLTDLVYIDIAHPHSGGLESEQRQLKMNNILRVISNYQQSDYTHLHALPHIQEYLGSKQYIEELQKFKEDDQYKRSLNLEPSSPVPSSSSSKESVSDAMAHQGRGSAASLNLSPSRGTGSMRLSSAPVKFVPGHRKSRSLGTKFRSTSLPRNFHKQGGPHLCSARPSLGTCVFRACHMGNPEDCGIDNPRHSTGDRHLLDDSVIEEHLELREDELHLKDDRLAEDEDCGLLLKNGSPLSELGMSVDDTFQMQGLLRRKTLLKEGKKPAVSSWQKHWMQLCGQSLVYFAPKSFKGFSTDHRSDYKRDPCKLVSVLGWTVTISDNTAQPDLQLTDPLRGNIYKLRASSRSEALKWYSSLQSAIRGGKEKPLPANLMSFE
ncbi:ras-specific guanine nucleotide-releasing factor RalGPS2 isoform X3 [Neocloeon triangulifer]|uniref:ras-specific guanine nucleotide-releasing factor RalGPS2 isoform X3 n=1 Tax=Neocloeon triangulifer TaxID=2078957 RepID=UPI00286EB4B0|nr:ras-specific guanine nucleotide-releasing factor RalGPS2 isoform X3 [Neocloeon triangulifer]